MLYILFHFTIITFSLLKQHHATNNNLSNNHHSALYCTNDKHCAYYRECCRDHQQVPAALTNIPPPTCATRRDIMALRPSDESLFIINTCQKWSSFEINNSHVTEKQFKYLAKKCQRHLAISEIFHRGRLRIKAFPVYHREFRIIFHSVYCALCNGFMKDQLRIPKVSKDVHMECNFNVSNVFTKRRNNMDHKNLLKRKKCWLTFGNFFDDVVRPCYRGLIDNSCQKGINHERCFSKAAYEVWHCENDTRKFRNEFCVRCFYNNNKSYKNLCKVNKLHSRHAFFGIRLPPIGRLNISKLGLVPISDFDFTSIIDNDDTLTDSLEDCHKLLMKEPILSIENVTRYIRNILAVVSVVGLVVLLTFFVWTGQYASNVDFITWGLCISIILYLLMDLESWFANFSDVTCRIKIFMKQTTLLSTFLWMLLFAVSLLRTFSASRRYSQHSVRGKLTRKRIVINILVSVVIPTIYTLALIIVDALLQPSLEATESAYGYLPGFVNGCICWYNHWKAMLIWLFAPTAVLITANTVICVIVLRIVIGMHKDSAFARGGKVPQTKNDEEKNKKLLKNRENDGVGANYKQDEKKATTTEIRKRNNKEQSRKQLFYLCLKMTVILGAYWLILFISIVVDIKIFKVIMAILCQGQGLFISLSIILTARNWKKFKQRLSTVSFSSSATKNSNVLRSTGGVNDSSVGKNISKEVDVKA